MSNPTMGVNRTFIRRTLAGIVSGSIIPAAGLLRNLAAFFQDPSRDRELAGLDAAVRADDTALVTRYVSEAARFVPFPPLLYRQCVKDVTLAPGTPRKATIHEGARVVVGLGSAMMDGEVIEDPARFSLDRPEWSYLFFGHGLHECMGRHMALTAMTEIVKAFLLHYNLRPRATPGHDVPVVQQALAYPPMDPPDLQVMIGAKPR
jgi:cytochrome P450